MWPFWMYTGHCTSQFLPYSIFCTVQQYAAYMYKNLPGLLSLILLPATLVYTVKTANLKQTKMSIQWRFLKDHFNC